MSLTATIVGATFNTDILCSHVQLAVSQGGRLLAAPRDDGKNIQLIQLEDEGDLLKVGKVTRLQGHEEDVNALLFTESPTQENEQLLLSASNETILLWQLNNGVCTRISNGDGAGDLEPGNVRYLGANGLENVGCACAGKQTIVFSLEPPEVRFLLQVHDDIVSGAAFIGSHKLLAVSEDRTFSIWNLNNGDLIYRSAIVSPSPFISVTIDYDATRAILGSANGTIKIFSLQEYRCQGTIDIGREILSMSKTEVGTLDPSKVEGKAKLPKGAINVISGRSGGSYLESDPEPILGVGYHMIKTQNAKVSDLLSTAESIVAFLPSGLVVIDVATMKIDEYMDYAYVTSDGDLHSVPSIASVCIGNPLLKPSNDIAVVLASAFTPEAVLLQLQISQTLGVFRTVAGKQEHYEDSMDTIVASMMAMDPLLESSPLHSSVHPPGANKAQASKDSGKKKQSSATSSPVTFGHKIKSSGYGINKKPPRKMFQPVTNSTASGSGSRRNSKQQTANDESYPMEGDPPSKLVFTLEGDATNITKLAVSHTGKHMGIAHTDGTVAIAKLPLSSKQGGQLRALHVSTASETITSCNWSFRDDAILTTGNFANVWDGSRTILDSVLTFDRSDYKIKKEKADEKISKTNPLFSEKSVCKYGLSRL
eukprot:m.275901 g.275901  ORF g.275901 m.275901 type:complete len:651 (-) comp16297_c1_seq2:45-1997(-)